MTDPEIIADALASHPDCTYGNVELGCDALFRLTRVAQLWRNEECYAKGDPPRHVVEGYPGYGRQNAV